MEDDMLAAGDEVLAMKDVGTQVVGGAIYPVTSVDAQGFSIQSKSLDPNNAPTELWFWHSELGTIFKPWRSGVTKAYTYVNPFLGVLYSDHGEQEEVTAKIELEMPKAKVCTCGVAKVGGGKHSSWCDGV
jgi:hypothetical protein